MVPALYHTDQMILGPGKVEVDLPSHAVSACAVLSIVVGVRP